MRNDEFFFAYDLRQFQYFVDGEPRRRAQAVDAIRRRYEAGEPGRIDTRTDCYATSGQGQHHGNGHPYPVRPQQLRPTPRENC